MSRTLQGDINGEGLKIAIVVATFNDFITSKLLEGAQSALTRHGVASTDITVANVPGSFEIPLIAKLLAGSWSKVYDSPRVDIKYIQKNTLQKHCLGKRREFRKEYMPYTATQTVYLSFGVRKYP